MSTTNWEERGQQAVGAAANLATGLIKGFRSLGGRIQAGRHLPVIEAFCACAGRVAAQNGSLKREEIEGFRRFLLDNRQHPLLGHFPADELVNKFRDYAVKAFLQEEEVFIRVLDQVTKGSDEANLIIAGCFTVVFADGDCDARERDQIEQLAGSLGVATAAIAQEMGVVLPPATSPVQPAGRDLPLAPASPPQVDVPPAPPPTGAPPRKTAPPPPVAPVHPAELPRPAAPPAAEPAKNLCSFCGGKGCAFCNNTGLASS